MFLEVYIIAGRNICSEKYWRTGVPQFLKFLLRILYNEFVLPSKEFHLYFYFFYYKNTFFFVKNLSVTNWNSSLNNTVQIDQTIVCHTIDSSRRKSRPFGHNFGDKLIHHHRFLTLQFRNKLWYCVRTFMKI